MRLKFSKMHGLGNDFVVLNGVTQAIQLSREQLRYLADRHRGVGCDQILLVESSTQHGVDFRYRIFNADGGEVEQCGNGARCFVQFVRDQGLSTKDEIRVETVSGIIAPRLNANGAVTVDMGAPRFVPGDIPFRRAERSPRYELDVGSVKINISALSMGNPHAVQVVGDVDAAPVLTQGPLIEQHPDFPARVNAGYMQIVNRGEIKLRVWERGAGETLACGSGACAAVVAGIALGLLDNRVAVHTHGGQLVIEWQGDGMPVMMTGPVETVFSGEIEL